MISIICNEDVFNLINEIPDGIHTYYNKKHKRFEYHYESNIDSDNLSMAPCAYEMKPQFWREFYNLLSKEDLRIAKCCPFGQGYFDYLKQVGLYETYQMAEYKAKLKALMIWFLKNDISLPENGIDIDCRYL